MFSVQSAANTGAPPSIPNFWEAYPLLSEGAGAGGGGGGGCGSAAAGGSSARLLRCFLSLSSSSPLSLPCSTNEDRGIRRRRRGRNADNKRLVHSVGARVQVTSNSSVGSINGGVAAAAAPTASSPEVLPEWLGGLGLDKEEEEDLVAAFAALPEPPPPAAADAKLVQAARDLVVSMKKPERAAGAGAGAGAGLSPKGGGAAEAKKKKRRTRERAKTARLPLRAETISLEVRNGEGLERDSGGWVELKSAPRAAKARGSPEANEPTETKKLAKEPLTEEAAGARDAWMQERLGLDDDAMVTMRETHMHVLKYRAREHLEPKLDWLQKELDLDDQTLGKMVSSAPAILRLSIEGSIKPKLGWVRSTLGLDRRATAKLMVSVPSLFNIHVATLEKKIAFLRGAEVNLSKVEVRRIVRSSPAILTFSIDENMRPKLDWLRERMGLDADGIRKMVGRNARVLSLKVETIEGKLMWLEGRLGMDRDKAVKVILTFPVMLSMALDTMDWKILWLQQRLSLTREQMMAVVVKYPNLLSYNIEDNLEPTLKWLEEDLGVDTVVAGKLVLRQPRLLSANLDDNLKNKVPWMVENLNLPRAVVLEVITGCPDLLNLSTARNLGPTIQFFYDEMGASKEEVSEMVAASGKPLMYSLEKRWRARVARIRERGVTPCFRDHWKPIANRIPARFDDWLETL